MIARLGRAPSRSEGGGRESGEHRGGIPVDNSQRSASWSLGGPTPSVPVLDCIEAETQRCWKIWPVSGQNAVESGIATPLRRGANRWINALNHGAEPATVCHGREPLRPSDRQDRERHNSSQTYWRRRFEPGVDSLLHADPLLG